MQQYKIGPCILGISTSTFLLRGTTALVLASVTAPITAHTIDIVFIFGAALVRAMTGSSAFRGVINNFA